MLTKTVIITGNQKKKIMREKSSLEYHCNNGCKKDPLIHGKNKWAKVGGERGYSHGLKVLPPTKRKTVTLRWRNLANTTLTR